MPITDTASGRTGCNVHALRIEPAAIRRLLHRSTAFEGPGALDFARRRALISVAVDVTRAEVSRMRKVLIDLRSYKSGHCHRPDGPVASREGLVEAIAAELEDILDENERRLSSFEDELSVIDGGRVRIDEGG